MGRVWAWTGHMWDDRIRMVLEHYGDRITDLSIFGWSVSAGGDLTETFDPALLDEYRQQWPHIRFWGCFRNMDDPNDGPRAIFDALRDSSTARARLADEVERMFTEYPWLHGVDIDLESGGDERSEESELIFEAVADRAHSLGRQVGAALPPLTATGSVGGENWVRYAQLGAMLDAVEIMSYDFAWSGSAPGPISPGFWLADVYDWATSQIDPSKVYMGLPLYAYFWRLHDYPENLGNYYRGLSGTYYAFWQQFTGAVSWYPGEHPDAAWLTYRDPASQSLWGYLHAYDWLDAAVWEDAEGVTAGHYEGRDYVVRYGWPAGSPQWSVADNSAGDAQSSYQLRAEPATDINGEPASPAEGYTLTVEMLQRAPVAATIVDDYATSSQQLDAIYRQPSGGDWDHVEVTDTYRQYRGSGPLEFDHDFGSRSLYLQGRFQWAEAGTVRVTAQGVTAELRNDGRLRLLQGGVVLESTWDRARPVGASPQLGQAVLGLRVREGSARAYVSDSETNVPVALEVETTPPGGPAGFDASGEIWLDHVYLGDGWWYMPREAVEVTIGGETRLLGRLERDGIEWDGSNRFRPVSDVDERDTRDDSIPLDWTYHHWPGAPIADGEQAPVAVVPTDHDTWLARLILFDSAIGVVAYCNDAQAVAHWRSRADHDWHLAGIALWSLGQEDVRLWDTLAGGELPAATKRLDE